MTSRSASTRFATSAPSVSLSPNLISSLTTVSFSLMTGITRCDNNASKVERAIRQVGVGQQHLGTAHRVFAQLRLVDLRQAHLADRGGGLQFVDLLRPHR